MAVDETNGLGSVPEEETSEVVSLDVPQSPVTREQAREMVQTWAELEARLNEIEGQ